MNFDKINLWILGVLMIFGGSCLIYYYGYKNYPFIDYPSYLLIFIGWVVLFMKATKNTIIDGKKILFTEDKVKCLQQFVARFFAYAIMVGLLAGNCFYFSELGNERKRDILKNGPTNTTIALVSEIDVRRGKTYDHYYALFKYTVNNKTIEHSWSEKEGDFFEGQKYEIKYSVEHPDMFSIIRMVQ
jgi:hypothetical protein